MPLWRRWREKRWRERGGGGGKGEWGGGEPEERGWEGTEVGEIVMLIKNEYCKLGDFHVRSFSRVNIVLKMFSAINFYIDVRIYIYMYLCA